ncbi:forkhead-associated domain-containing protein 1 isoform X3 [Silurus meridionalis]|uniref:forkhead-associated domain-containing protein 1 isoform X3 n=1 Tax=Silurus meridionalis TaxID=175797 RepID=UPI001EEAC76B|nr:forkhead-associated domain-containing protein 1 isoform X3 [Silurus meridionalis]
MRGYLKTLNWMFKLQPKSTTVGRHRDSDLCLQNGGVDEHHATIEWNEIKHCYVLTDLNSAHGTYVNDCQIHNATVCLTPGDELHFGYGGSAYKLLVDPAVPLPVLPNQSNGSPAGVRNHAVPSSATPRPPCKPRPASVGPKRSSLGTNVSECTVSSHRPGSGPSSIGKGLIFKNASCQNMQDLLHDKEECWARCKEEQSGVLGSQSEVYRKECMISALKEEVSALRLQLSQNNQNDPDIKYKLHNLARDIQEKKEEIQQLKEQMMEMSARTGELNNQAVAERDHRISNLQKQLEKLKSESRESTAQINSVQKDLLAREKQALKLAAEVDSLRKEARHKDAQLSNMANKLSKLKEIEKHQEEFLAREKEVESLRKTVEQMDMTLREKHKEMNQQNAERDLLKRRLDQKTQEQSTLQFEMSKLKQQQQQTLQREQKAQSELRHTQTRLENIRSQIMKHVLVTSETVSEQELLDLLSELRKQKDMNNSRVEELEQKLEERNVNQRVVEEDTEKLKARLAEFQTNVQNVYLLDAMQRQISALQNENVCPAVSWVQAHTLSIVSTLHTLLEDTADAMLAMGVEVSEKTGGVLGAVKTLCQQYKEAQLKLRRLQAKEKPAKLEDTVKLQLEKISSDLDAANKTEAVLHSEIETLELKWHAKLEVAEKIEIELREKVGELELQKEQWREKAKEGEVREDEWRIRVKEALQRGTEEERERYKVEIEEYREQVRQHAHTIVALEEQMSSAKQKAREMQEQRDSVTQQLKEVLDKKEDVKPCESLMQPEELQQLKQTVTSLRASLEASQHEVVRQGEVITSLSCDLAHAHAQLSDITGELSEQQKIELEAHKTLVVDQRMQLSMLTELLEQKKEELRTMTEKLGQAKADLKERTKDTGLIPLTTPYCKDVGIMVSPKHQPNQVSKCKVCHQKELIHQGKANLSAMKERISAAERKWPYKVLSQQREPLKQNQKKQAPKQNFLQSEPLKQDQKKQASKQNFLQSETLSGFAFPEALSEAALERTARLDLSDALDLSEMTYVDLARSLCEALELSELQLSGCVPLKHLPPEEREHMASLRQQDLKLLRRQLAMQNNLAQNKAQLLQESQREIQTLSLFPSHSSRDSQAAAQQLQIELSSELAKMKLETNTLRQALEDTQTQLQHGTNHRKRMVLKMEKVEERSRRIGHHNCIPENNFGRVAVMKRLRKQERRQKAEDEKDILMNGHKEPESCKMAAGVGSP